MNNQPPIKFLRGLQQKPDPDISEGFVELTNLDLEELGVAKSVLINDVGISYGDIVHSLSIEGLTNSDPFLTGVGTNLYLGPTVLKSDLSGQVIQFASSGNRIYFTTETDGLWVYDGTGSIFRAGSPVPDSAPSLATSGAGSFNGDYTVKVTFGNGNGFDGSPSSASSDLTTSSNEIDVSSIATNSDTDYDVVNRKLWIKGGTDPVYVNYVLLDTISDNTTTTSSNLDTSDVDTTILLEDDNDLPPSYPLLVNHYGVLLLALNNSLRFSKSALAEQWPTANEFVISRSGDPIMNLVPWNQVTYIMTRRKIVQMIGSPGQGALVTNFFIKDTKSTQGTVARQSAVGTPYGMFFHAEDGIRVFNGDTSDVFSDPIHDLMKNRNMNDPYLQKSRMAFWDNKLVMSYVSKDSTVPDSTVIYDFRNQQWHHHNKGYRSLLTDQKTDILYAGTANALERFRRGSSYHSWSIKKNFMPSIGLINTYGKWQVDMKGEATLEIFYDGVSQASYTLSTSSRDLLEDRMPPGMAQRVALKLTGDAKSTQDELYSMIYSSQQQRERI